MRMFADQRVLFLALLLAPSPSLVACANPFGSATSTATPRKAEYWTPVVTFTDKTFPAIPPANGDLDG